MFVSNDAQAEHQVLILFSSTCPLCRETLPFWKRMAIDLSARGPAAGSASGSVARTRAADAVSGEGQTSR